MLRHFKVTALLFSLLFSASATQATVKLKIASTAPEGTTWANSLDKISTEVAKKTNNEVNFKMYHGGKAGDESSVLRQIRIGKMNGGVFTGKTLGEINGDIRVMEIPFTFYEKRDLAFNFLEKNWAFFADGFEKKGHKLMSFFEIGPVYLVSKKEVKSLQDLKGLKIWTWEGDELASSFIKSMNLVGVPLGLEGVLSALSTGMIEMAYSSPLGIISLQWQNNIQYLINFPVTFSVGAFVLSQKEWNKVPEKWRAVVEDIVKKNAKEANEEIVAENQKSLDTMKMIGIEFQEMKEADFAEGKAIREKVIESLTGKLFSPEAVSLLKEGVKI